MPGRIIYLEVDDEITSAAARIRASSEPRLAVILPYGSRVATSRINFRLLSRDALTHEKQLSIVSGDPATRALAASAGLPVFGSVAEYESAMVGIEDDEAPRPATDVPVVAATAATMAPAPTTLEESGSGASGTDAAAAAAIDAEDEPPPVFQPSGDGTLGLVTPPAVAVAAAAATAFPAATAAPGDTIRTPVLHDPLPGAYPRAPLPGGAGGFGTRRTTTIGAGASRIRTPWLIGGAILALAILVAGVGLYLLLPSATIAVTPRPERLGPIPVTVVADTTATEPDAGRRVVPASEISIPVAVNDTFSATGKRVELTKATGTVRFENLDPTSTNRIVAGSVVRTGAGIRFRTQATITVPRAELVGLQIFPARASVKVTAIDGGEDGNVDAGTIVVVPSGENSIFLKVANPQPTSGGTRTEFTRVTQADVDGALAALNQSLAAAFQDAMADPSLETGGASVFPSTGRLGEPTPDVAPDTLVGQEVTTFPLGLSATGTVIAVDAAPVTEIAGAELRAAVAPGHELVAGSVDIEVGDALIIGQTVSFPVTATAEQIAILDPEALKAQVLGKPIEEARAILEPYGQVTLDVSPDWTGSVPTFESRVTLTIDQAVQIETSAPSGSQPSPAVRPVPSATPPGSPAP